MQEGQILQGNGAEGSSTAGKQCRRVRYCSETVQKGQILQGNVQKGQILQGVKIGAGRSDTTGGQAFPPKPSRPQHQRDLHTRKTCPPQLSVEIWWCNVADRAIFGSVGKSESGGPGALVSQKFTGHPRPRSKPLFTFVVSCNFVPSRTSTRKGTKLFFQSRPPDVTLGLFGAVFVLRRSG